MCARNVVLGLGIGVMLVRVVASILVGTFDNDAIVFVTFTTVVTAIATLGSLAPAWRATKVDPLAALRHE